MRPAVCFFLLTALSVGVFLSAGESGPVAAPRDQTHALMQAKLSAIHQIAEGLVRKDFEQIEESGATLAALSSGKDWQHHGDSVYGVHREQLNRAGLKLAELARVKNLEGATYGYITMISTCVDCHTHCRDVLRIADPMPVLRPVPNPAELDDDRRVR